MQKVFGTYHKDCIDGTAAAAVVLRKFPHAKLFPLAHAYTQEDIDPIVAQADSETAFYTVDCALGAKEFLATGAKVTTIDHHIGGKDAFEKMAKENPCYTYVFDNEKSGSSLSWAYLFPEEAEPDVITYIEDADLWRLRFGEDTKSVNNYLSMFRNDPKAMLALIEGDLEEIKEKGSVITAYADSEILKQIQTPPIIFRIAAYEVPVFNISCYESATGNILSKKQGKAVATFVIRGAFVKLSFRSLDEHLPSSLELATLLNGGGHKNAAGATIPLEDFLKMITIPA